MPNTAEILYQLEEAQRELERRQEAVIMQARWRKELIQAALKASVKQAEIARITGLTRARVAQLRSPAESV